MKTRLSLINKLQLAALLLISVTLVQCKKDGANAGSVSRALVDAVDSTIFSPFYDSTVVPYAESSTSPSANDIVVTKSVMSIIKNNCVTASCHGGTGVKPYLNTYADVKSMVVPGNPEASQLFQLITTSDLNKAMPPVNYGVDLTVTEKTIIYNWIKNGAKEKPALEDYRPAAVAIISSGCTSGNCHNQATAVGYWARNNYITYQSSDTATFAFTNQVSGAITYYPQMVNRTLLNSTWQAYKDSCRKFYADTLANASFRIWKTFSSRGPLNTYDDIVFDALYPKSIRSAANAFTVNSVKVNSKGDPLTSTSTILSRVDTTLLLRQQRAYAPSVAAWATKNQGDMAYSDGGLRPSEVAIIKGWYFADPNIPDAWKYGTDGTGIFKYTKSGKIITK